VVQELIDSGEFDTMSVEADAQEHSLELHLPYLYKTFEGHAWKLVHVMVGRVPHERQAVFGRVFARFVEISSSLLFIRLIVINLEEERVSFLSGLHLMLACIADISMIQTIYSSSRRTFAIGDDGINALSC